MLQIHKKIVVKENMGKRKFHSRGTSRGQKANKKMLNRNSEMKIKPPNNMHLCLHKIGKN